MIVAGSTVSATRTEKGQVLVLPAPSVAVAVTVCSPTLKAVVPEITLPLPAPMGLAA